MDEQGGSRTRILDENTLEVVDETHTLMGALKWVISNNWRGKTVEFCGYNVPHPSDKRVNLSIQLESERQTQGDLLEKVTEGLVCLEECCEALCNKLDAALANN